MNTSQTPNPGNSNKSRVYLGLAAVFLALMSLLWSLDDSFIYIFGGLAVYFLFLFYWTRPTQTARASARSQADQFYENFKKTFGREPGSAPRQKYRATRTSQVDSKKVVGVITAIVFFGFFATIFFSILLWDDQPGEPSYYYQAESFRLNGDFDSAKHYYRYAMHEDGMEAVALTGYGNSLISEEAYDSAIKYFDWALEADEYYDEARYNKALALYYLKEYTKARSEARELLEYNPGYSYANLLIGDCFSSQENYDSAIYWYEIGYSEGVASAPLSHAMAWIYDKKGNTERAIQLYQEALYYDSSMVEVYDRLAEMIPEQATMYRQLSDRHRSN